MAKFQIISFIIFSAILTLLYTSCEATKVCDCNDPNRQHFTLTDDLTNQNLLSGTYQRYFRDSITLFSIERKNGNNFRTDYLVETDANDSIFIATFNTQSVSQYFIGWNNRDLDTIDINTRVTSGSCCGGLFMIESLYFNNTPCENSNIWVLKKK